MAGVILGTASILSSTTTLIASLHHLTSRLRSLSGPRSIEIREKDRRRLLALQRRVDALSEPLTFALVAARSVASRDFVLYARRLLGDVELFLESQLRFQFVDEGKTLTPSSAESLDFYLSELTFVLNGLNTFYLSPANASLSIRPLSPSALLQASHRVSEHRHLVGEVLSVGDAAKLQVVRKEDKKFYVLIGEQPEFTLSLSHNVRYSQDRLLWEEEEFVMVDEEGRRRSSEARMTEVEFKLNHTDEWSIDSVVYLLRLCAFENDTKQNHVGLSDLTIKLLLDY